jgi:hypothetical protein
MTGLGTTTAGETFVPLFSLSIEMPQKEVIRDRQTALEMLCGVPAREPELAKKVNPRRSTPGPAPIVRQRPCCCGRCKACADNARWERVFNEKFADVEYYSGLRLAQRSPLASF